MTRRLPFILGGCLLALVLAWGAGFVWFVHLATRPVPPPPHADAIVAFTGGADRVATALHLLVEGKAAALLLSGIGGGAELRDLARRADLNPRPIAARVTIGREALTTHGNARETAAWARNRSIHSLIVVTAFYHMPRALAELRRALPDVRLYPDPVLMPRHGGIGHLVTLRLMAEEYTKYLAVVSGLSSLVPLRLHGASL
ncbi:MAG TPA: YdcF family protein [Acetobacteraceae bacterium]|nr:YdcF family protein [Acetobacteraceae bacterium]